MISHSRRNFLKHTSLTAASTLLNFKLASSAAAQNTTIGEDNKTLVCLHFNGGMDGFHMLMPRDDTRYDHYSTSRSNLAIEQGDLLALTEQDAASATSLYGLHPEAGGLADMFNGNNDFDANPCAAFIGNVGTLIKPLDLDSYLIGQTGVDIPVGLAGHFLQAEQWRTSIPQGIAKLTGWIGRTADLIHDDYNQADASMNISLAGNNLLQSGSIARPFAYSSALSSGLSNPTSNVNSLNYLKNVFHSRMLEQSYDENLVDQAFSQNSTLSLQKQIAIRDAVNNYDTNQFIEQYPTDSLNRAFKDATILIAVRDQLGLSRQTIFLESTGWDNHFELTDAFADNIATVSEAVARFQRNINHLGLANSVVGFTTSEFARTLRSTGAGSDHAWGGPQLIFGGPVNSGKILGTYPSLELDNDQDIGRGGRFIPSHGCDEYFGELLSWFGVDNNQLNEILPNYHYFSDRADIGIIKPS